MQESSDFKIHLTLFIHFSIGPVWLPKFQMVCERPPAAFGGSPPREGENKALTSEALISPS
jgi:hypothetical protein